MKVIEGKWGDVPWEFIADEHEPDLELCTAAFCIVTHQGKLVLVEHHSRGYEFTGGHVDPQEKIADTVIREIREESRVVIKSSRFFGYKKVSPLKPIPHRDKPGQFYPFPHSYIPYYVADAIEILDSEEFTPDIKSVRLATYEEGLALLEPGQSHEKILNYLVAKNFIQIDQD